MAPSFQQLLDCPVELTHAKHALLEHFARIGKAVSSPARLELLNLLAQGEKPVERLASQAGLSITNTSNHLKELRTAGLVASRKHGPWVRYRLADPAVHVFLRSLQEVAHRQLADVRQIVHACFAEPATLEAVNANELVERLRADDVTVVDVRPEDEYVAGHIPGAISIPAGEIERRLSELPDGREIVAYCRGPYCVLAVHAVAVLRSHGYRARRLEDGLPDWRARGFAVTASAALPGSKAVDG